MTKRWDRCQFTEVVNGHARRCELHPHSGHHYYKNKAGEYRSFGSPAKPPVEMSHRRATQVTKRILRAVVGMGAALAFTLGCSGAQFDLNTEEGNDGGQDTRTDPATDGGDSATGEHSDIVTPPNDAPGGETGPGKDGEADFGGSDTGGTPLADTGPDTSPPADTCPYDAADHHNGYDGPYTYCAPKGDAVTPSTYSLGMALAARASSSVPGSVDTAGTCPSGSFVRRASASKCVTWGYDGTAFGRVTYGAICGCPEATGPRWD